MKIRSKILQNHTYAISIPSIHQSPLFLEPYIARIRPFSSSFFHSNVKLQCLFRLRLYLLFSSEPTRNCIRLKTTSFLCRPRQSLKICRFGFSPCLNSKHGPASSEPFQITVQIHEQNEPNSENSVASLNYRYKNIKLESFFSSSKITQVPQSITLTHLWTQLFTQYIHLHSTVTLTHIHVYNKQNFKSSIQTQKKIRAPINFENWAEFKTTFDDVYNPKLFAFSFGIIMYV